MLVPLQDAASFLRDHHRVFEELWRRRDESLTDADLLLVIKSTDPGATAPYLLGKLKQLRFMVESSGQPGVWEFAAPFHRWLEYLQLTARPVSSSVVQGYLTELRLLLDTFRAAEATGDVNTGRDVLRDTRNSFHTLVEGLGQTRAAIAAAVSEAKKENSDLPALERFRRINRLWNDYLIPLMELLDPAGALEALCVAWENQLSHALEKRFLPERRIADRIENDMQFLRVAVRQSFRECRNELAPLHARLRRDTLWAQGAARLLSQVELLGPDVAELADALPLSSFRFTGHVSSAALAASAAVWLEIKTPPALIDFSDARIDTDSQAVEELLADIDGEPAETFPIQDLTLWLSDKHAHRGFHAILQAFSFVVTDARYRTRFSHPISEYTVAGGVVRCGRVHVDLAKTL